VGDLQIGKRRRREWWCGVGADVISGEILEGRRFRRTGCTASLSPPRGDEAPPLRTTHRWRAILIHVHQERRAKTTAAAGSDARVGRKGMGPRDHCVVAYDDRSGGEAGG
jgi:hypothetical protein